VNIEEQLKLLQEAQGDPGKLALVSMDLVLSGRPQEMRRALEAAAVPHWFDQQLLASLLDGGMEQRSEAMYQALIALPMVESFASRSGYNVHEATRLALRERLQQQDPDRLKELSSKVADALQGGEEHVRAERAYHLLLSDPGSGGRAIWALAEELRTRSLSAESASTSLSGGVHPEMERLGRMLNEYRSAAWPAQVRGWAHMLGANIDPDMQARRRDGAMAAQLFEEADDRWMECLAKVNAGHVEERMGDFTKALSLYTEAAELLAGFRAANPDDLDLKLRDANLRMDLGDACLGLGRASRTMEHYRAALELYRELHAGGASDLRLLQAQVRPLHKLAEIHQNRRNPDEAIACLSEAREVVSRLQEAKPEGTQWHMELAHIHLKLGESHESKGDIRGARSQYEAHHAIVSGLLEQDPASHSLQVSLSVVQNKLGRLALQARRLEEAAVWFDRSLSIRDAHYRQDPRSTEVMRRLRFSFNNMGLLAQGKGNRSEAADWYRKEAMLAQQLADRDPSNELWQSEYAGALVQLGDLLESGHALEEALSYFQKAHEVTLYLSERRPDTARWAHQRWESHVRLGDLYRAMGNLTSAYDQYTEAIKHAQRLADLDPRNLRWKDDLMNALNKAGLVAKKQGRVEDALQVFRSAQEIAARYAGDEGAGLLWKEDYMRSLCNLASLYLDTGDHAAARRDYERALEIARAIAEASPDRDDKARLPVYRLWELGNVCSVADDADAMLNYYEQALRTGPQEANSPQNAEAIILSLRKAAFAHRRVGDLSTALQYLNRAAQLIEEQVAITSPAMWYSERVGVWKEEGRAYMAATDFDRAAECFGRVVALVEAATKERSETPQGKAELAEVYGQLGRCEAARRNLRAAVNLLERQVKLCEDLVAKDPSNLEWRNELLSAYEQLINTFATAGMQGRIFALTDKYIALAETLSEEHAMSAEAKDHLRHLRSAQRLGFIMTGALLAIGAITWYFTKWWIALLVVAGFVVLAKLLGPRISHYRTVRGLKRTIKRKQGRPSA